jgi:hypothetical protein
VFIENDNISEFNNDIMNVQAAKVTIVFKKGGVWHLCGIAIYIKKKVS